MERYLARLGCTAGLWHFQNTGAAHQRLSGAAISGIAWGLYWRALLEGNGLQVTSAHENLAHISAPQSPLLDVGCPQSAVDVFVVRCTKLPPQHIGQRHRHCVCRTQYCIEHGLGMALG